MEKHRENASPDPDVEAGRQPLTDFEKVDPVSSVGAPLSEIQSNVYGSRPECFSSTLQECLFVLTTTFAVGESSIFTGVIICLTSYVGDDLNMSAAEITWMTAACSLSAGAFLLLFGRVADLFGRRPLLLISMLFYTICLLILGFANNAIHMDVFCGLIGLCSAAAVPPAIGKLGAVYDKPSRRKNRAFACFSAGNPVGFAIGAFISGVVMQIASWRASFWVVAVIYAVFTAIAFWTTPPDTEQTTGGFNRETFAKFDFLGAFLAVIGIAMFTAALTLAGNAPHGWRTGYVIALLIVGVVLTVTFVYWQSIFKHPLMPLHVWRDRNFSLLNLILCLGFYGFSGNFFWITLVWQRIQRSSPLMVAVQLLPAMIGGIVVNIIAAMVMHRVSNKLLMAIGAIGLVVASILLSAMSEHSSYWAFYFPALLLSVVGADFEFTVTNMYVMSSMPVEQQSVGGGLFNTVSRLSAAIGIGLQTSVYNALGGGAQEPSALKYRPYQSTFWVALGGAAVALIFLPFLTIKSQGGKRKKLPPVDAEGEKTS